MTLRGTRYIPKLIVFYAYWGGNVEAYLSAFKRSVEEFTELGVALEFGLVDLAQEPGKKCKYLHKVHIVTHRLQCCLFDHLPKVYYRLRNGALYTSNI